MSTVSATPGAIGRRGGKQWIQTWSGRRAWPAALWPDDIDLRDIARSLSMLCRFNGHVSSFYSVAEHSVRVSFECDPTDAAAGLLHDAAEAYVGDMTRPLKYLDGMEEYREIEAECQWTIFGRFGLAGAIPPSVKAADNILLRAEAYALKAPLDPEWAEWLDGIPDVGLVIEPWSQPVAERLFLARARHLGLM